MSRLLMFLKKNLLKQKIQLIFQYSFILIFLANSSSNLGCFKDNVDGVNVLPLKKENLDPNSPIICVNYCLDKGYNYAGVENG